MITIQEIAELSRENPAKARAIVFKEALKCKSDPVYTISSYFSVLDPIKGKRTKFRLYPFQDVALKDFEEYRYNLSMKTRQMGFSTITAAYAAWYLATKSNRIIYVIANKKTTSRKFLKMVKEMLMDAKKRAPWLIADFSPDNNGKDSFSLMTGSTITAEANSEEAARSETINLLIIDEVAAIDKKFKGRMDDIWASAGPTLSRSRGSCIAISCVTEDTYVFTDKGIEQIKDFIPPNIDKSKKETYTIPEYNLLGKDKKRKGTSFHVNGYGETRNIITPYAELEGSLEHKIWTISNAEPDWVRYEQLKEGDWVNVHYNTQCWGSNDDVSSFIPSIKPVNTPHRKEFDPKVLTPDICYFLGLYIAGGCMNNNSVFISCGDGVSQNLEKLGLSYYLDPKKETRHQISATVLVEFMKFLGFDPSHKANQKEIPKRLFSISKENMKALVQGIFDGDGYSTVKSNRVGINVKSSKLIEQLRIILLNFGVLSYKSSISKEQLNTYYSKKDITHRYDTHSLEINGYFATKFHEEIGFRIPRKLNTQKQYKTFKSSLPNSYNIVKELCEIANTSIDTLRTKHKVYIHYNSNPSREKVEEILNFICTQKPELNNHPRIHEIRDKYLIPNSVWVPITKIEEKEALTYDFDLPETDDVTWCKSAVYNGLLIYDTPKGSQGWYYDQYVEAEKLGWNVINAHWSEHPEYSKGLYLFIPNGDTKNTLERMEATYKIKALYSIEVKDGLLYHFNETWPLTKTQAERNKYKTRETYEYILDGKLRCPWYDWEAKKLGKEKTKSELDCSFSGSGGEVLDSEIIQEYERRTIKQTNPEEKGMLKSLKVFKKYHPDHEYVLIADNATGDGSDYSAFVIWDITTMEDVVTFKEQLAPKLFAKYIDTWGKKYGGCLVIVENAGGGLTTLTELTDTYSYNKIYYTILKKREPGKKEKKRKIGFWQTNETRSLGGDEIEDAVNNYKLKINSIDIVREFYTWIWTKEGRREHAAGKNDDLIMCLTMGMYYIRYVHTFRTKNRDVMRKALLRDTQSLNLNKTQINKYNTGGSNL